MKSDSNFQIAFAHHQAGRLADAERIYREILSANPNHVDSLHMLGVLASQAGHGDAAVELIIKAVQLDPKFAAAFSNLGLIFQGMGRLGEAAAAARRAIQLNPQFSDAHNLLGNILLDQGQLEAAIAAYRRAIQFQPTQPHLHNNLGLALAHARRYDQAAAAFEKAIELNRAFADAYANLSVALVELKDFPKAIAAAETAIRLNPNLSGAYNNLGNALTNNGQFADAVVAYRKCIELDPKNAEVHNNLGNALHATGEVDPGLAEFQAALQLRSDYAIALNNIGNAHKDKGQLDAALAAYRKAVELDPTYVRAHSNVVYTIHFHQDYDAKRILDENVLWAKRHEAPLARQIIAPTNDRSPNRKLRIGYISPYFREHCLAFFTLPLLENHDHSQFEIFCYSDVSRPDSITERIRRCADQWKNTAGASDEQLAQIIRDDKIDILVDLIMHMADSRLLVFARKPAPVQVTWSAYPSTTGLSAIDYRLTDPYLDPPGQGDEFYSERSIRLPHSFWCYQPTLETPEINPLPALSAGTFTFGCINNFAKVTPPTLELWSNVLNAIPNSRLLIQAFSGSHRNDLLQTFAQAGVAEDRIEFLGRVSQAEYFALYHRIDLCLDPIPYGGHTTTFDGLWMGVPVVTLSGNTAASRGATSILKNMGLTQFIAHSPEQYVEIASQMAGNLTQLAELRPTLRQRMQNSPLCDGKKFAADVEAAYRTMWQRWCSGGKQ